MVGENEEELTKLVDVIDIEDLSQIIYRYDINDDIRIYYKNLENHILHWEDLNECLQFMPYNKLNNFFEEILRPTHNVVGKFPEQVVLLKK